MSKRLFYGLFKEAWELALTEDNILSVWEKTGIVPYNPSKVLDKLKTRPLAPPKDETTTQDSKEPPTPRSAKAFRHFKLQFQRNLTKSILRRLFKSAEQASAEREIANFRAAGLREALDIERKKRQRGKKLNLLGEVADGSGQFFSGVEIKAALESQKRKEDDFLKEKEEKEAKKQQNAIDREVKKALAAQEKKLKAEQMAEQRAVDRQVKAEAKKQETEQARAAKKEAREAEKVAKKAKPSKTVLLKLGSSLPKSLGSHEVVEVEEVGVQEVVVAHVTRSGRQIILPERHRQ